MKHKAPVTDRRAAYMQDAADLRRKADELELRGHGREALHLRMEADELRSEAPPHYTVEHSEYSGLWLIFEDGADIACFESEEKARALAHAANVHDSGIVEKLEAQLHVIRETLEAERRQARSNLVNAQRFGG